MLETIMGILRKDFGRRDSGSCEVVIGYGCGKDLVEDQHGICEPGVKA